MGSFKKEKARRTREGKTGDGIHVKGENFYRTAKRVKQLNIWKEGKAQRNADGQIVKAASYQSRDVPNARIEPNRKWFTNSRVISQESLSAFREAMAERQNDPYSVLLKSNKLPMSLVRDGQDTENGIKKHHAKMTVESSPFSEVFGPKMQRKRVKLSVASISELANDTEKSLDKYHDRLEEIKLLSGQSGGDAGQDARPVEDESNITTATEAVFYKGQSKRIWNELYKVIDSSDVILHLLDARDPLGTRCRSVEQYLKKEAPHKHLVFVLNKCDLVPTKVAAQWVRVLQKEYPTAAFRASMTNPFGKGSLINLLRQFSKLHSDRKQVSVGLIGYPNTGKSSVINTLRGKKVATVAPIPGETKVWQYVTLMKRIYLIDCPGIVPQQHHDTPQELLLRGVVRVEKVDNPEQYIPAVLAKVKPKHMERTYELSGWKDHIHFLELLARKSGRLLKGGEPDLDSIAKMVLTDFMRGRIPWFTAPPTVEGEDGEVTEGREGRLGEMPKKRKRDETEAAAESAPSKLPPSKKEEEEEEEEGDFEGFGSESEPDLESDSESATGDSEDVIPLDVSSDEDEDAKSDAAEEEDDDEEGEDSSGVDYPDEESDEEARAVVEEPQLSARKRRKH